VFNFYAILLYVVSILGAITITDITIVTNWVGGISSGMVMFLLPSYFFYYVYTNFASKEKKDTTWNKALYYSCLPIFVIGCLIWVHLFYSEI